MLIRLHPQSNHAHGASAGLNNVISTYIAALGRRTPHCAEQVPRPGVAASALPVSRDRIAPIVGVYPLLVKLRKASR